MKTTDVTQLGIQSPAPVVAGRISGNFVMLRAESLRLLLPQQDVGAAQYVEHEPRAMAQPGVFEHGEGDDARWVVALSAQMRPLARFPGDRIVLASLEADGAALSFAWDEVQVLIDAEFERHELPMALRVPDAPIDAYVERDGEVVLCTTAKRVLAYAMATGG
jgi:hypothetical protein